jgi:mono/diheme cytochrome c family protein
MFKFSARPAANLPVPALRARMKVIFNATAALLFLSFGPACESGPPPFTGPRTLLRIGEPALVVPAETLNHGQKLYNRYCASCHGYEGGGDGPAARNLTPKPRDFRAADFLYTTTGEGNLPSDADLRATIREGVTPRGMPAWPGFQVADADALVSYIKTFSPRWQAAAAQ